MFKFNRISCIFVFAATILASSYAFACFTVVVGKDASATGEIIVGHNEDNDRRIVMAQYYVPRMAHESGEVIEMEATTAKIPQVAETFAYYWTQTLAPDGYSFSDGFINEWGVSLVSNNCISSREEKPFIKDGGIGYGVRRIIAERAKTAREGVDIAIELINKYGYTHPGRSYQIVDKNEAWMLQIVRGNRYVARRVLDDEVTLIANAYTIRNVNLNDKKNIIASPDLITYAIDQGWYKPAKKDDYSDFDFARVYQQDETREDAFNNRRHKTALKIFTGKDYNDPQNYPTSVKVERKVTVDDIKNILRGHTEGEVRPNGLFHHTMNDICNVDTQESVIIQMRANPELILTWRATGRPCVTPYVPAYPLAGVPNGQNWLDPVSAQNQHFNYNPNNFDYNSARTWWTFIMVQKYLNYLDKDVASVQQIIAAYEKSWQEQLPSVEAKAAFKLASAKPVKAIDYLYNFSAHQARVARAAMQDVFNKLDVNEFAIMADKLSQKDRGTVKAVLYSQKGFDASKIDKKNTTLGIAHTGVTEELHLDLAKPTKYEVQDVNKDGLADMVMTYKISDVVKETFQGVITDLYLQTYNGKNKVIAFDTVLVTK